MASTEDNSETWNDIRYVQNDTISLFISYHKRERKFAPHFFQTHRKNGVMFHLQDN